jgi:hypothetical protein
MKWLEKNTLASDKKLLVFSLGFLAANLTLVTKLITERQAATIFALLFIGMLLTVLVLGYPREKSNSKVHQSRWGILSFALLAYGVGLLLYHERDRFEWLWYKFRKIDRPDEWVLFTLFLIGVMLGFFVVRNWNKEQKDFITSLTAVFGAAFVSTMLGQLNTVADSVLVPTTTFAYYALGFTLSGIINLVAFAFLVAHYTRTQSSTSRSVIDFLYGSDKAKAIDGYFLKNFEEDPNYAKVKLIGALNSYREIIKDEFAKKMGIRKAKHEGMLAANLSSPPGCDLGDAVPPFDYFELLSIKTVSPPPASPPDVPVEETFEILFRKLPDGADAIKADMFRVAISMKWLDHLEYVVAPGEYKKDLAYAGSVAGLALEVKQTIVMDRDRYKKFRGKSLPDGKTPNETDEPRGLHRIDYLSYIVVPMTSSFGRQEETALGVLHLDTKLFGFPKGSFPEGSCGDYAAAISGSDVYRVTRKRKELDKFAIYAANLYEEKDELIESLERMRAVIVPLLELYQKCRTGAGG